jgi:hypothetical protein
VVPDAWSAGAPLRVVTHLRSALDGPVRVLHQSPSALYVEVAGRCVGVVAPGAAQVPCALRLPAQISGVSAQQVLAAGADSPYVERGTLYLAGNPLRVGRFVDVRVPRIDLGRVLRAASPRIAEARPPRPAAAGLAALGDRASAAPVLQRPAAAGLAALGDRASAAPVLQRPAAAGLAALTLAAEIDVHLLQRLVGNGGGLTPLGDDVLCGWLAVLVATDNLTDDVAAAVRGTLDRTTLLSATLLDCALHGEVLPEFATYVTALGTPAEDAAATELLAIGHTSGAGLWWGARHALATLAMENAA